MNLDAFQGPSDSAEQQQPQAAMQTPPAQPGAGQQIALAPQQQQQLMPRLRSPTGQHQQQDILQILKSNPPLMAAFIKQKQKEQKQLQSAGGVGGVGPVAAMGGGPTPGAPALSDNDMQQ